MPTLGFVVLNFDRDTRQWTAGFHGGHRTGLFGLRLLQCWLWTGGSPTI